MSCREALRERIRKEPEWFMRKLGGNPWSKEVEIAEAVHAHRRVAVRGCVSSGKTHASALTAYSWIAAYSPARVFTIAPSYRQVDNNLWGEIKRIHSSAPVKLGGRMYLTTEYRLGPDTYMLGFSTKEPSMVHGIHGKNDLLIIDDAHGIPKAIFDEVENMMAGGNTHVLMLFNPVALSGETYDCTHTKRKLYHNIQIPFSSTPNACGRVVIPGALTSTQVEEWIATYGKDSNFCRVKVFADYPTQESDTLIPLSWCELAVERGRSVCYEELIADETLGRWLGVDCARFGGDASCIAPMIDVHVIEVDVMRGMRTTEVAGRAIRKQEEIGGRPTAYVDVIGIGAGVVDSMFEHEAPVSEVNVSEESDTGDDKYSNLRSQVCGQLREALDPEGEHPISLPNDPELVGELSSVKYGIDSKGRVAVESKKDMRKRLGRSPDRADAVCLANYGRLCGTTDILGVY